MTMTPEELRAALEAILFVSGEPVKYEDLLESFSDEGKEAVDAQLAAIEESFRDRQGGFILEKAAGGYRFASRPELDPWLRKFFARKNETRLSMAGLETLAIIAYRQPITVPEINDIRGVNSSGVIRTLLDRKMIKIAGRKNVVGSPFLYRTSRDFLVHFGLESIQDLPNLEEFTEILGEGLGDELLTRPPAQEVLFEEGEEQAAGFAAAEESAPEESASEDQAPQGLDAGGEDNSPERDAKENAIPGTFDEWGGAPDPGGEDLEDEMRDSPAPSSEMNERETDSPDRDGAAGTESEIDSEAVESEVNDRS